MADYKYQFCLYFQLIADSLLFFIYNRITYVIDV